MQNFTRPLLSNKTDRGGSGGERGLRLGNESWADSKRDVDHCGLCDLL